MSRPTGNSPTDGGELAPQGRVNRGSVRRGRYILRVKALFGSDDGRGAVYVEFCAVLKRYKSRELDARGVERAVSQLFKGATTKL